MHSLSHKIVHSFSWMKGWPRAWFKLMRLVGSRVSMRSSKSFSCVTLRCWSSGRRWQPISSARRSFGFPQLEMTVTFSWGRECRRSARGHDIISWLQSRGYTVLPQLNAQWRQRSGSLQLRTPHTRGKCVISYNPWNNGRCTKQNSYGARWQLNKRYSEWISTVQITATSLHSLPQSIIITANACVYANRMRMLALCFQQVLSTVLAAWG